MTNRKRVTKGQSIKSAIDTQWFNEGIPPLLGGQIKPEGESIHREEVIYCVVGDNSGTAPSFPFPYRVMGILGQVEPGDLDRFVPTISDESIDEYNWVISLEGTEPKSVCLTVIGGITKAWVRLVDPAHKFVTWDCDNQDLATHATRGKAQLLLPGNPLADPPTPSLIYISKFPSEDEIPMMRFFTTGKIFDREVTAIIDLVSGGVINPLSTSNPKCAYKQGDAVLLYDPGNIFGEIEADATGIAYYRRAAQISSPLPEEEKWEIEECTQPIKLIRGKIDQCLFYDDFGGQARFGAQSGAGEEWILSSQPNIDFPPLTEVEVYNDDDYAIAFENTFHLDAVTDSIVTIRRVTNVEESDPGNLRAPKFRSATTAHWELIEVFEQVARWARFRNNGQLINYWEGADPRLCNVDNFTCAFDCSCLEDDDEIICFYDPKGHEYIGISTEAALLGPPDTTDIVQAVAFDGTNGCQLNFVHQQAKVFFCGSDPVLDTTTQASQTIKVPTGFGYGGEGKICLSWQEINVPICSSGSHSSACVSICDILCDCPELISVPEICDPPPIECTCCDECFFENGVTSLSIDWNSDPQTAIRIESISGPCSWLAIFDDPSGPGGERTWTITYDCDGVWNATGAWPGTTNNGTAMSLNGVGDCGGATLDGANFPNSPVGADGVVTADGIPCTPPDGCCRVWSGDEVVIQFFGSSDEFDITFIQQIGPVGTDGPCYASFEVEANIFDNNTDETCDVICHCELSFIEDHPNPGDKTCVWNIDFPTCIEVPAWLGKTIAITNDCTYAECLDAGGDCDASWTNFIFEVEDPDTSIDNGTCLSEAPAAQAMLLSAFGDNLTPTAAKRTQAGFPPLGLGDDFIKANPKMFVGCKCKQSVKHVMNRWTRGQVSQDKINRVASTILNKSPGLDRNELIELLERFINDEK